MTDLTIGDQALRLGLAQVARVDEEAQKALSASALVVAEVAVGVEAGAGQADSTIGSIEFTNTSVASGSSQVVGSTS